MSSNSNDIPFDTLKNAKLENLIRLARFIGIPEDEIIKYSQKNGKANDQQFRLAALISHWNNRHPQKKKCKNYFK